MTLRRPVSRPARPLNRSTPPLRLILTCPVCSGSTQNPDAPSELADDVGTCLMCCDPSRMCFDAPGRIDGAPIIRTIELDGLMAATDTHNVSLKQLMVIRDQLHTRLLERGLLGPVLARLTGGAKNTFSDRVADAVDRIVSAH